MTLNNDAKFEEKLTSRFETDIRNLANFHQSTFKSLTMVTLMGSFCLKEKIYELKFVGELCATTMKNDTRFEQKLTCQFKIDMKYLTNFDPST